MKIRVHDSVNGQLALLMTAAILVAAAVQLAVLLVERNRTDLIEMSAPAMTRFADMANEALTTPDASVWENRQRMFRRRGGRLTQTRESLIDLRQLERSQMLERQLTRTMTDLGHPRMEVQAATRVFRPDQSAGFGPGGDDRPPSPERSGGKVREMVFAVRAPSGRWINGAFIGPMPPDGEFGRLFAGVLAAIVCVLAGAVWLSARISRPLKDLAEAASSVGKASAPTEVRIQGPLEVRQTLEAFNQMTRRVESLLNEKDVMLGALGHDLRTPLASLRIRLESMEPASERDRAVGTIEETTALLESILDFARAGRSTEPMQEVDLADVLADLARDYTDAGEKVTVLTTTPAIIQCRPMLIRRMLRNLVDNACQHGEAVSIRLDQTAENATITISDDGPGIPDANLEAVRQPFVRGDQSRNRAHGGAGLGLALADAIARAHDGVVSLANASPSGLVVTIILPRKGKAA